MSECPSTRAGWREWIRSVKPGEVRRRAGVKQRDLAALIGVAPVTLSGWERSGGKVPREGGAEWFEAVTVLLAAQRGAGDVRLVFRPYDVGAADILVCGKHAGICLDEGAGRWRAYLYRALSSSRIRLGGEEEVTARTLGELRRVLRERVAERGPWWTG